MLASVLAPTSYQREFIDHIVGIYKLDRTYARWSAVNLAEINPWQLLDLPAMVKRELQQLGLIPLDAPPVADLAVVVSESTADDGLIMASDAQAQTDDELDGLFA